ncbi:nickel pincer cofactor biosynthesis protein LarB [Salinirubrum litoreum]|uniref:Nickel pincer cofactor biosynthesis protein LarB n=1 Tax=Salinirubrum litoreum TaxID=1126234 RepID=A0ABD5RF37_9EURY|nr:nickel pincer cofactor biosynthesis protein LarB [Salinirubrum litoreum]
MRELFEAVADGEVSPAEAEARLTGYASTDAGRFDAGRESRSGVPEAVLADGKTTAEITTLAEAALTTTGRAIVTRIGPEQAAAVTAEGVTDDGSVTDEYHDRARVLTLHAEGFERPDLDATVAVVTGGTADRAVAGEATVVLREMGADVTRIDDVGVAHLGRVLDELDAIRAADVAVVAAGREGALPTVVAGLVDTPVVGVPVASGYGHAGDGEAALSGLLQSCTALSVVNVDAGFTAGVQAGLIARTVSAARRESTE